MYSVDKAKLNMLVLCTPLMLLMSSVRLGLAFQVFWNVPSEQCRTSFGIDLYSVVRQFGISVNKGDSFYGDVIAIYYDTKLGLYPKLKPDGTPVNGGIPQLGNLGNHLKKAAADIKAITPNVQSGGLRVIDWEAWRPTWEFNWEPLRIYQEKSIELVKELYPDWDENSIKKLAVLQWENSTKEYMLETLELAKKIAPNNSWCYYLFPDCYNYNGNSPEEFQCSSDIRKGNDKLKWLWATSTALCPSVYVYENHLNKYNFQQRTWYTNGRLLEAIRDNSSIAVYPYINYSLKPGIMVPETDFWRVLAQIASLGMEGAVIWGSSSTVASRSLCAQLQKYVIEIMGQAVEKISWNSARCCKQVCHGKGRCTWPQDNSVTAWKYFVETKDHEFEPSAIKCKCDTGYYGKYCEKTESTYNSLKINQE